MRLQKYMAHCGVASRRKCEKMIQEGRVSVNGKVVKELGTKVKPQIDKVTVDGKSIYMENKKLYILLNKPRGYITTVKDPHGRPTVLSLVGQQPGRVYPVGRLDFDSEGLLLLTNDGDMALRLTHPRYEIEKEYYVIVSGYPSINQIQKLLNGIHIGDWIASAYKIKLLWKKHNRSAFNVILKEGKNRQIRRMFEAINCPVLFLRRERMANISIGILKPGEWRYLCNKEIRDLTKITGGNIC